MNSLQICDGLITKKRKTEQRYEESVLDLFLVCDKMLPFVTKLHVDVQGNHQLTNFSHNGGKVTETDHATVVLYVNMNFPIMKPQRIEEYNFRNTKCQNRFKVLTTNTTSLSSWFTTDQPFTKQTQ